MNKHFYLKHEIMSFNDSRIQNMISREGGKAYGTYWYIFGETELSARYGSGHEIPETFCHP